MRQIFLMIAVGALVGCGQKGIERILWEFETKVYGNRSPSIGPDGTVYFGINSSGNEKLYAINGKTGAKLWEFQTGGNTGDPPPAIGTNGTVYVGSDDKKLYAIKTDSKGPAQSAWPMGGQNAQRTGRVK